MTREQIEVRIRFVEQMLCEARHPEDIRTCNRILERLIMLDADEEQPLFKDAGEDGPWFYEDDLPEEMDITPEMFAASKVIDGVRMYSAKSIEDAHGTEEPTT